MSTQQKPAALVLSHQGFSFLEELCSKIEKQGFDICILSSQPALSNKTRIEQLQKLSSELIVTESPDLEWNDIVEAMTSLQERGLDLRYCVAVWEAYRPLMAKANQLLGARDLSPETCLQLLDKLEIRNRLFELGLSKVKVDLLSLENFHQKKTEKAFVKPRFGLGSFGAHRLKADESFENIEAIRRSMQTDAEYRSVFKSTDLIAESYIPGVECSFEILVDQGNCNFFAVHEKARVEENGNSTFEEVCLSPPASITSEQVESGKAFVREVFKQLGLGSGCFHLEAKCDGENWEILEFNPRIGGALVKESIRALSSYCLVEAWLDQLAGRDLRLPKSSESQSSTYFRVYFGEFGLKIKALEEKSLSIPPSFSSLAAKAGQSFSKSPKEVFLGQALWSKDQPSWTASDLLALNSESEKLFEVTYE